MASRTAACVFSATGTIGSRTVSAHLPSSDSAYLAGAGLVSMNSADMQRHQLVLQLERARIIVLEAAAWNSAHSRGATFDVTEMQPWPPWAMKPSAVTSSPES